jgi:hypothetical protein
MIKRHFLCLLSIIFSVTLLSLWMFMPSQTLEDAPPVTVIDHASMLKAYPSDDLKSTAGATIRSQDNYTLCQVILTGTIRSTYTITNPEGVSGFTDYHLVNFDQRLLKQSDTVIEIEITSRRYIDTRTPFPVDKNSLPEEIKGYLLPTTWIQSEDPLILAKAIELVSNAAIQAEAVDAIQSWIRGNIAYDYTFSLPNDASSVFRNQSGVCAGFSNLTVALLRAAGIPSRVHSGCVTKWGWVVSDAGGWHAWIEVYYPDVGWIAADPQTTVNFIDTSHILKGFDQCGETGTVITRTNFMADYGFLYDLRTVYTNSAWNTIKVASILAWDRHPLMVSPESPSIMLPISNPVGTLPLQVENLGCWSEDWKINSDSSWISPTVVTGTTAGTAVFNIDAMGMDIGRFKAPLTIYGSASPWWDGSISRTITAKLWLVESIYHSYLPFTSR